MAQEMDWTDSDPSRPRPGLDDSLTSNPIDDPIESLGSTDAIADHCISPAYDEVDVDSCPTSANPSRQPSDPLQMLSTAIGCDPNFVDRGVAFFLPPDENRLTDKSQGEAAHRVYLDGIEVDISAVSKYDLRLAARENRDGFDNTWIDQDETGDYDPEVEVQKARAEQRQQRLRLNRQRCAERGTLTLQNEIKTAVEPERLITTLTFSDSETKRRLVSFIAFGSDADSGYRLRERQIRNSCAPGDEFGGYNTNQSAAPTERGCRHCASLGLACSIIDDEFEYPCKVCSEDLEACELIRPPVRKRGCETCKRKKRSCSYKRTYKHSSRCRECARYGTPCVAGPAKDAIPVRLRYPSEGVDAEAHAARIRKLLATKKPNVTKFCDTCKKSKAKFPSQVAGRSGKSSLICCDAGDDFETLSGLPTEQQILPQHNSSHPSNQQVSSPPANASKPIARCSTTSSPELMITTRFFHPIVFNHNATSDPTESCHFCQEPTLAIFGLVPRQIRVTLTADGAGYEELDGEDNELGVVNTKICTLCTYTRMQIATCAMHDLRPIPWAKGNDDGSALEAAIGRLENGSLSGSEDWCSICPNLATYKCTSPQEVTDEGVTPDCGCGLRVCDTCAITLSMEYSGDLQQMLAEVADEHSEQRPWGLRADAELLREDGLLVRYVMLSDA